MDKAVKIAHCVESYFPAKGGMPEVVRQLSERMVANGHDVTVFTSHHPDRKSDLINGVRVKSYAIIGNEVNGIIGDTKSYITDLKQGDFDVVVCFAAQQWSYDAIADELPTIPGKKVFVPTGFSHFFNPQYSGYFDQLKRRITYFDANVFLSNDYADINFARANNAHGIYIIPNGAAEEEFERNGIGSIREKLNIPQDAQLVLHVGSYTGIKGHREAIELFIRARTHNAVLLLIGEKNKILKKYFYTHPSYFKLNLLRLLKRKRILFEELNREETVAAFKSADLFLFPSNVECSPIVLFESMAAGVPFLASTAGNTSEIIEWSRGGWLLPCVRRTNGWADVKLDEAVPFLEQTLNNKIALREAGKGGHAAWKSRFTWALITAEYLKLYHSLQSKQ
jgi:glycosyltransferase involved in cell wall biosynthesis